MPELGEIRSSPTLATAPGANELAPPPLLVNASEASPQASLNAVTNTAEQKNMMNNIKVGGGTKRRRRRLRRRTCTCRRKKCRCMSRGRGSRSRRKSKGQRFTASQRQIVNRRVEFNLLHRKIRKNKNTQNRTRSQRQAQYGGNISNLPLATTPQHGESCGPGQHNCPGNSSTLLLEVHRQSIVNAQGDTPS